MTFAMQPSLAKFDLEQLLVSGVLNITSSQLAFSVQLGKMINIPVTASKRQELQSCLVYKIFGSNTNLNI